MQTLSFSRSSLSILFLLIDDEESNSQRFSHSISSHFASSLFHFIGLLVFSCFTYWSNAFHWFYSLDFFFTTISALFFFLFLWLTSHSLESIKFIEFYSFILSILCYNWLFLIIIIITSLIKVPALFFTALLFIISSLPSVLHSLISILFLDGKKPSYESVRFQSIFPHTLGSFTIGNSFSSASFRKDSFMLGSFYEREIFSRIFDHTSILSSPFFSLWSDFFFAFFLCRELINLFSLLLHLIFSFSLRFILVSCSHWSPKHHYYWLWILKNWLRWWLDSAHKQWCWWWKCW